jgi:DNA-binding Lrp family transcriptional regulator
VKQPNYQCDSLTDLDSRIVGLLKAGLPLSSRTFHIYAQQLEIAVDEVLFRSNRLAETGHIHRIAPLI